MTTTELIIGIIKDIPRGKVISYGGVARLAGIPNGARLVVRVLHSSSGKHALPWWRVVKGDGSIAMADETGGAEQRDKLETEGIGFLPDGRVNMDIHAWQG